MHCLRKLLIWESLANLTWNPKQYAWKQFLEFLLEVFGKAFQAIRFEFDASLGLQNSPIYKLACQWLFKFLFSGQRYDWNHTVDSK